MMDVGQIQTILERECKTYKYDGPATHYIVKYIEH